MPMRAKTQTLIHQNYEVIKQSMLSADSSKPAFAGENGLNSQGGSAKPALGGLFQLLAQPKKGANAKKRNENESLLADPGMFSYKFKEGHSKNFKRELTIDFFIN